MHQLLLLSVGLLSCTVAASNPSTPHSHGPSPKGSSIAQPGNATFDYVIIGGGTAGLTVASRLAENHAISVAVIEAGGFYEIDSGNISVVPGYSTFYAGTSPNDTDSKIDWDFVTTPQAGAADRRLHYARGKTLGGSSARNFLLYQRQTIGSADLWAKEVEDESYTFANLLPFYKKGVHYTSPSVAFSNSSNTQDLSAFSAAGGPLEVSFGGYNDPFATWMQQGLEGIGQTSIAGFQSGNLIGSAYFPSTIDPVKATRSSSESSYLHSVLNTTSLSVYNNTLAQKILFRGRTAIAVVVSSNDLNYVLNARKEIIVSAGTFQSPQLLMVSGIGPRETLQDLGIPVVKDLAGVGQNLCDQAYFGTTFPVNVPTGSTGLNNPSLAQAAIEAYQESASGPLSVSATGILGWENLPSPYRDNLTKNALEALNSFPEDWPELEFLPVSGVLGYQGNYQTEDPVDGHNYATIATAVVAPLSRGNITINSTTMLDPPIINPNWLTDPVDIELAIASFKRQRQIWKGLGNLTTGPEKIPGDGTQSDAEILNFIRESLSPLWHAAATCKMGRSLDPLAVVDSKMKVYGVENLRVVDASSFPFLPPGHPQATIYAVAEKFASVILQDLALPANHTNSWVVSQRGI